MKSQIKSENYQIVVQTDSPEQTRSMGTLIGSWIETHQFIGLTGDLGCGKTVFVQGIARGLDVPKDEYITSPTYTLINDYVGRRPLIHIDLYRTSFGCSDEDFGLSDYFNSENVVVIEWVEKLEQKIEDGIFIHISMIDDNCRTFTFHASGSQSIQIIKKLKNAQIFS